MSEFLLSLAGSVSVPGCSSIFPASLSSTSESRMFLLFERFKQITNGINEPIIKKAPDIRKAGLYDPKLSAISPKNIRDQDHFLLAQSSTVARVQYDESLYTAVSRKVVGRNAHAIIPKGNMGYDQYTVRND